MGRLDGKVAPVAGSRRGIGGEAPAAPGDDTAAYSSYDPESDDISGEVILASGGMRG